MAKEKKEVKTERVKKTAKERNSEHRDNYQTINDVNGVETQVLHIREQGCIVREVTKQGNVSSIFVPNVKPKKKGVNYTLIQDTPEQRAKKAQQRATKKASGKVSKKK